MARKPGKIRTESDWRDCIWPHFLFDYLRGHGGPCPPGKASDRKLRLFACACCRSIWHLLPNELCHRAVELSEAYADRVVTKKEVEEAGRAVIKGLPAGSKGAMAAAEAAFGSNNISSALSVLASRARLKEEAVQCDLLRDIFGNPFRPVTFNSAWRTSDVVALARGIYEDRAFDRMPILADALQDAGCDSDDILSHCRDANQPHVRGCWVVDLVLGKE